MVLHLPEIATLICSFLPRSDCARLCYTSRTVFSAAAPFVWWSIDGPRLLRTLLERVEFPPIDHLSQFPRMKIAFRDEDRIDHFFSRFDVYAPYVKVLHVYGTGILYYRVEGWSVLISRARKHALLPNLRKLHFKMPHKPHPPDYFMWMTTFYSSSLVDISITPSDSDAPPLISYRTASLVLKSLMQHCPKIQRLSLLPNRELNSHYKDRETTILACLPVDPFYRYMNAATSLRHLTGTFAWFQENALLVLGRLPNLERIDICSSSDIPFKHMGSLLPAGSFSALRRLDMNTSPFDHVSTVMNTKHLVGRLEALDIVFKHAELQLHGIESAKDNRFQKLFVDTPCLRDLCLAISSRERLFLFDNTMLHVLAGFPLQSVSLSGISFDEGARLEDLGNIWPKVTSLRMPDHDSTLAELGAFTRMPNLCHLSLRLQFCSPIAPDSLEGYVSTAPLEVLDSSVLGRMCSNSEELDVVEHVLTSYWPRLKYVFWDGGYWDSQAIALLNQLNQRLASRQ